MASQITNHPSFQTVNIRQGTNDEEVIYVYYRISYIFLKSIGSYIVVQSEFGSLLKRNNSFMIWRSQVSDLKITYVVFLAAY